MKISKRITLFLFAALAFTACHFPKMKDFNFKKDRSEIIAELKKHGDFENASIMNNVTTMNGNTTYELSIELTNGKNLPAGQDLKDLAKEKMSFVLDNLMNKSDYNNLKVVFITSKGNGLVSTSTKMSYDFSIDDFQKSDSLQKDSIEIKSSSGLQN